MIGMLKGEVAVRRTDHVVILCAGVGYRAAVSAETLKHVPAAGEETTLHSHLIVRDDALQLYGFHTEEERDLFLMLLSVQAVGPKVALAVLSGGTPRELMAAIAGQDAARFQATPGIGKRTAERIIVELREKVGDATPASGPIVARRGEGPMALARDGLIELGYAPGEAEELLRGAEGDSAEELLAQALRTARTQ
jgi:holliday junction DNA helicase RuvA